MKKSVVHSPGGSGPAGSGPGSRGASAAWALPLAHALLIACGSTNSAPPNSSNPAEGGAAIAPGGSGDGGGGDATTADAQGSTSSSGTNSDSGSATGSGSSGASSGSGSGSGSGSVDSGADGAGQADGAGLEEAGTAIGKTTAPDCPGCAFPPAGAPSCSGVPAIHVVYPPDSVIVPPNLNGISVQWTPYGAPFTSFEVDFASPSGTDWRVVTRCATQTVDVQTVAATGGCELGVDPTTWAALAAANRGGNPISITVRGTTDGACASTSTNAPSMSLTDEDVAGTFYYWKSTVSPTAVGGAIWAKTFGDPTTAERDVTTAALPASVCVGCHVLSRDGSRMLVSATDKDSEDGFSDVGMSLLDMTTAPTATEFQGGVTAPRSGGQPPGFAAIAPSTTFYVASNGVPLSTGTGQSSTTNGYPAMVPSNGWSLWNAQTGTFVAAVPIGPTGTRPTMPDWSADGTTLVYVQPQAIGAWDNDGGSAFTGARTDDDHVFGGSLYAVPYMGNGSFGTSTVLLQSGGENNYYPSYSPDSPASFVLFDRAPLDMSGGSLTACSTAPPSCPNDSFANPAARVMILANSAGTQPIDLEEANGSSASAAMLLSNSYPRWAPFSQTYKGQRLLWITFSSTRDYGLRVLNGKAGMTQCYPPDVLETPGEAHGLAYPASCRQPQLWMAAITVPGAGSVTSDPSHVAFWLPGQDITTHNHGAQWAK